MSEEIMNLINDSSSAYTTGKILFICGIFIWLVTIIACLILIRIGKFKKKKVENYYLKEIISSFILLIGLVIGVFLIITSAFFLSDEAENIKKANNILVNETKIIMQEDDFIVKAYYKIERKNDYGLNLHLRIFNATENKLEDANIIDKNTNCVFKNISIEPYEYIDIEFKQDVEYTDELNIEIIDAKWNKG